MKFHRHNILDFNDTLTNKEYFKSKLLLVKLSLNLMKTANNSLVFLFNINLEEYQIQLLY